MSDKVVILVTAASKEEGRRIAERLVEARLAACVNITAPIESVYRWEEKIAHDEEYQLIIKSTRELFPEIKEAIRQIHSYRTPEIVCLPIVEGSREYLQWLEESVRTPRPVENS